MPDLRLETPRWSTDIILAQHRSKRLIPMNLVTASRKQSPFIKLAAAILAGLSRASIVRPRTRYVNPGEFPLHLQRDMGFLDGQGTPGAGGGPDTHGPSVRGWLQ
jgi:hypothetical protein